MTTSRGFSINDGYYNNGANFNNLDDMQPPKQRFSPIILRSDNLEYQHQDRGNGYRQETFKSERSNFCSKKCLIGLAIGLGIGVLVVLAIAIPLGVIPRCGVGILTSTPNWIGTFQADNQCDTTRCCCFTNQITFTQPNNNLLQIAGSVTGQCASFTPTVALTQPIPTTFLALITWAGETIRVQLGQDNAYVSFVNVARGFCSGTAVRTSYNAGSMKSINLVLIIFMLSIIMGIMK